MYGLRRASRILNDKRFVFSLSIKDFVGVLTVFVVLSAALDNTPYALMAFVGAILFALILAPIRIKHRDHYIRDLMFFYIIKTFRGRL